HVKLILGVAGVVGVVAGLWRWGWPRYRMARAKVTGVTDAILGRDAIVDTITGRESALALPGIGGRRASQEQQMEMLTVTVTKLVDQQTHQELLAQRLTAVETVQLDHATELAALRALAVGP